MVKPTLEFFDIAKVDWTPVPDAVPGLRERILAEDEETGVATRILQFDPGTDTSPSGVQRHPFWEEVYILEGSIRDLSLDETFVAGMYACRPPGMPHGPWISEDGCTTFEVRYSVDGEAD
jgi:hypothetical protein